MTAVADVSLEIGSGERVALLGPNGSGKSTLLRLLTGYLSPDEGTIRMAGHEAGQDLLGLRRQIGFVPENVALDPERRVIGFLRFCGGLRGLSGDRLRQRIDAVVTACQLHTVAGCRLGTLSRGFRQRVALAQALLAEPPVLLLDEPTVGLDPRQTAEIRRVLRELGDRTTLVWSTHLLDEVGDLGGRVILLHHGRVIADGTPTDLARQTSGTQRWLVAVDGPGPHLPPLLADVPGVVRVTEETMIPEAHRRFLVELRPEADPSLLAASVLQAGGRLQEFRPAPLSLSEIFLRLTESA